MRKIVLLFVSLCFMMKMYAQDKVFVIFTSTKSEVKGVWNFVSNDYRVEKVWDAPHYFTLFDRAGGDRKQSYFYMFIYKNERQKASSPFFVKPDSFLNNVILIDWDKISSKSEAETQYKSILSYDEIFFIDRKESVNDSVKIYPVRLQVFKKY